MEPVIDLGFTAQALLADARLTNEDILHAELERARHALAYLKGKIGNEAMRDLLADDLAEMTARVRGWVQEADGAWQTGSVELVLPGPSAAVFRAWYAAAMANQWEEQLRSGHPEHFINHPSADSIEVVENVGETELPWHIFYRSLPDDAVYPSPWDDRYAVHFGAEILDRDGLRVGFSMRELRDDVDGMHMKLTSHLPAAAPSGLLRRHLTHFSIEYRNWARFALANDGQPSPSHAAKPVT